MRQPTFFPYLSTYKRRMLVAPFIFLVLSLAGCANSGNQPNPNPDPNPTFSTWDNAKWDESRWEK